MKINILKVCSMIVLMAVIFSCKNKTNTTASEQLPSPDDGSENKTWKFCELDCAVDCSLANVYNTKEGSALFYIPIPEEAELSPYTISKDGLTVSFKCTNSKYEGKLINKKIVIPNGLAKKEAGNLKIHVVFEDYDCEKPGTKGTKNKGSVLQGNPFLNPSPEECICPK